MQITLHRDTTAEADFGRRRADWLAPGVVLGLLRAADAVAILTSGLLAYFIQHGTAFPPALMLYSLAITVLLAINGFQFANIYSFKSLTNLYDQARRLIMAWPLVLALMLVLGFATQTLDEISRGWAGLWFVLGFAALIAVRVGFGMRIRAWYRAGRLVKHVVVIGAGEHARRFIEHLRNSDRSVNLIGLFDDRRDRVPDYIGGFPVLGTVDDLLVFARQHRIDQVIIALPWGAEGRLLKWMKKLRNLPVDVRLCPDMIGFHLPHRGITHIGGIPLLNVAEKPLAGWDYIVKSCEDRILAALILLAIAPVMAVIAILVRATSPGPALFKQKRYGFNNEIIEVFKFRSMYVDNCDTSPLGEVKQASRNDSRVTPFGRFLRRTSLDELPQLLNVLKGDMSIVGPRPHAIAHNEQYARLIDEYLARHRVKPGITGWAQVNGLRGETDTLEKMERRVQFDLYYIENWSLAFDMKVILLTIFVGFTHPNAY